MMRTAFFLASVCLVSMLSSQLQAQPNERPSAPDPILGSVVGQIKGIVVVDVSKTRLIAETRVRPTLYVDESGEERTRPVHYCTYTTVSEPRHLALDMASLRVTQPDGTQLDPGQSSKRLVEGTAVVICRTRELPALWQKVLSEKTIVIFQVERVPTLPVPPLPAWQPATLAPPVETVHTH